MELVGVGARAVGAFEVEISLTCPALVLPSIVSVLGKVDKAVGWLMVIECEAEAAGEAAASGAGEFVGVATPLLGGGFLLSTFAASIFAAIFRIGTDTAELEVELDAVSRSASLLPSSPSKCVSTFHLSIS